MKSLLNPYILGLMLGSTPLAALTIEIDYTYDTNNFFDTDEKRQAMEAVAGFFEDVIADNLLRIDASEFPQASWNATFINPSNGQQVILNNLVVPEGVVIIYAGGRALQSQISGQGGPGGFSASGFSSWLDRVQGRGKAGALETPPTEVSIWGGSVTFNSTATWNFSLTENQAGREFVNVALHELGHVLGIGTRPTWDALVSNGTFIGPAAVQSYGSAPPADGGHLLPDGPTLNSPLFGSFGTEHGLVRPALMLPVATDTGTNFDVATDLDLAVLADLGWDVRPMPKLAVPALSPAAAEFDWPSVSFYDYRIERGTDLVDFPDGSGVFPGNGAMLSWADPSPPSGRAFYRLAAELNVAVPAAATADGVVIEMREDEDSGKIRTIEQAPVWITDCGCAGG